MAARKKKAAKKAGGKKPRAKKGKAAKRIPWSEVRIAWVTDPGANMTALARRFGCGADAIQRKAKEQDWQDERDEYVRDLIARVRDRVATHHAKAVGKQLEDTLRQMNKLRDLVLAQLAERVEKGEEVFERSIQEVTEEPVKDGEGKKTGKTKLVKKTMRTRPVPLDTPFMLRILEAHLRVARGALGLDEKGGRARLPAAEAEDVDFEIR